MYHIKHLFNALIRMLKCTIYCLIRVHRRIIFVIAREGDGTRTVASSVVGERVRLNGDIFTADVSTVKAQGETHDRCRSEQLTNLPATAEGYGTGLYGKDNDIGGEGGSRAWVGSVRRRGKEKRVVRVDLESAKLKEFQCSALDDKIEVL